MNDDLREIAKKVILPLISRAGKAMKIPLPRNPKRFYSPKKCSPQQITMEEVQKELQKIEAEKLEIGKRNAKLKQSNCFRTISRSSNVSFTKVSPLNCSPPLGSYDIKYELQTPKITGNIKYRPIPLQKSTSSRMMKTNARLHSPALKIPHKLEESKSQISFNLFQSILSPSKSPTLLIIKQASPRNLTPSNTHTLNS